jgi:tetratricopeptide (TPR) repeat protein
MISRKIKAMQGAARRVLDNYQSTGEPFCLFLSSWSFDGVRARFLEILDDIGLREFKGRGKQDVQVRIGLERQVRILLQRDGLETVAVYRKGYQERIAQPDEWPSLSLADDVWRAEVSRLVTQADLIVLFWGTTSPGLAEEVEMCSSGSIPWKTVVVKTGSPREIWLSQLWKSFPRVVPLDEIPPFFALHAEFMPLIDRMKEIKKVDPSVRKGIVDPQERLRKFPLPPGNRRFDHDVWIEWQPQGQGDDAQAQRHDPARADSATTTNEQSPLDLARTYESESNALRARGDLSGALEKLVARRAGQEKVVALCPDSAEAQDNLAGVNVAIGDLLQEQGALSDAAAAFHAALAIVQRLARANPSDPGRQRQVAMAHNRLSYVCSAKGDFTGAAAELETSLAIRTRMAEADPDNPQWKGELVITYEKIGDLWLRVGKSDSALRAYKSAVPLLQRLTEIAPYHNRSWQSDLAGIQARIEKAKQALRDSRCLVRLSCSRQVHALRDEELERHAPHLPRSPQAGLRSIRRDAHRDLPHHSPLNNTGRFDFAFDSDHSSGF